MTAIFLVFERASLIGLVALLLALVAQFVLERKVPAARRVWIWRGALLQIAVALVPLAPLQLAVLPPQIKGSTQIQGVMASTAPIEDTMVQGEAKVPPPYPAPQGVGTHLPSPVGIILGWLYVFGVAVHFAILARSLWRVRRLRRSCSLIPDGVAHSLLRQVAQKMRISSLPYMLQSAGESPLLVGTIRPIVILPRALDLSPNPHLEAILSHELAHIKRLDLAWNMGLWFIQTIFWFHPLTWCSRHFLSLEIESACDEMVLSSIQITPQSYGALLVDNMNNQYIPSPLTAGINDGFRALKTRLGRLGQVTARPNTVGRVSFVCGLLLACASAVPFRLVERAQAAPSGRLTTAVEKDSGSLKRPSSRSNSSNAPQDANPSFSAIQYLLRGRGFYQSEIDGLSGPATVQAVKSFQKSKGLAVNGIVGPQTFSRLAVKVRRGSKGDAVRAVQVLLRDLPDAVEGQKYNSALEVDGVFGTLTEKAVRSAQWDFNNIVNADKKANGIKEDGIVGSQTWQVLLRSFTKAF